jgi:hypothetical protein
MHAEAERMQKWARVSSPSFKSLLMCTQYTMSVYVHTSKLGENVQMPSPICTHEH